MSGTRNDLPDQLQASAGDRPGVQAAVAVLVAHGHWLDHPSFLFSCVRTFRDQSWIYWPIVRPFLATTCCSALDSEVLLLAADLATNGTGRRLHESNVLRQLDDDVYRAIAEAVDMVSKQAPSGRDDRA
jgi:hypothetical protein